jgi:phosphatidylglycerol:prolipoprotein diacylglycerol transferase
VKPLIPNFPVVKFPIFGDFAIHGFGILVAVGFMLGSRMSMGKAARDGLDPELINRIVGWMVAGVFIGGHLGHLLFYYPEQILSDPMSILRVWDGLSSFGGFLACAILAVVFFQREQARIRSVNRQRAKANKELLPGINLPGYFDALFYGFTLGWFFGRMGCFVAHDHAGVPTDFALGVYGMCKDMPADPVVACDGLVSCVERVGFLIDSPRLASFGTACHDLGLYEAFWSLAMIPLFTLLDRKPRFPGFFAGMWLLCYGPARLVLDIFRTTDTRYFGVTPAQVGSLAMIAVGIAILVTQRNKKPLVIAHAERVAAAGGVAASEATGSESAAPAPAAPPVD